MFRSTAFLTCCVATLLFAGEARAGLLYKADLDGPSEAPPVASPGVGWTQVEFDPVSHFMHVRFEFTGLLAGVTAAHIHGPTALPFAGTASVMTQTPTFAGTPLGATSGSFDGWFDMTLASSWRAGFITFAGGTTALAEAVFGQALLDGKAYLNIHTTAFPGGEIRGFLRPVPEPATFGMMLFGATGVLFLRRKPAAG